MNLMVFWPQSSISRGKDYLSIDYACAQHVVLGQWNTLPSEVFVFQRSMIGRTWMSWQTSTFVYHPGSLSLRAGGDEFFSQDSCGCFFRGAYTRYTEGGDVKERKKSPLVSGPQRQHGEPSCHPAGIKGPSVVCCWATNMVAHPGTGGPGWGRGCKQRVRALRTPGLK